MTVDRHLLGYIKSRVGGAGQILLEDPELPLAERLTRAAHEAFGCWDAEAIPDGDRQEFLFLRSALTRHWADFLLMSDEELEELEARFLAFAVRFVWDPSRDRLA